MAGFFDSLLGLETNPEDRDYRTPNEFTSPDELEAYKAGSSSMGIPGLDYLRSMARGAGKEVSESSMAPFGERYDEEMAAHERRLEIGRAHV